MEEGCKRWIDRTVEIIGIRRVENKGHLADLNQIYKVDKIF